MLQTVINELNVLIHTSHFCWFII